MAFIPWVPCNHPGLAYGAPSALHCLLTIPVARPCDISSPRENRGEGQTDGVKRSLGGKGFGDSANAAWLPCGPSAIPQAHPVHVCETSCFARFVCWQELQHPAAILAFSLSDHPWSLRLSTLLPFCPFPPCILRVSSADGALPSADSSPNAISLDLSLGQCSLRSNTVWPRNRQVKARYRTQANRKQWDLTRGMHI